MSDDLTFDEALDEALDYLEAGAGQFEPVLAWFVDNLVQVIEELTTGDCSLYGAAGYEVARVGDQIVLVGEDPCVMTSEQARMLAVALLRAAESADLVH